MQQGSLTLSEIRTLLAAVSLGLAGTASTYAHPGSGIAIDSQGQIYFVDTGQGVWRVNSKGELTLIHTMPYHWMAIDEKGHYARSHNLGNFDGGSFERITPAGSVPALVISSDYPIAVGHDGGLYYVPFNRTVRRELVRRMPDGQRSVLASLPIDTGPKPVLWVNGIASGPDGSLYITENDAVLRITPDGIVSTVRSAIDPRDCADPLPDTPKLPYLRGIAVAHDGTIYAAASGCRTVISIPLKGPVQTVLKAERPWSPTGVALFGNEVYVLEYLHTSGGDRKEWLPRVRRIMSDGKTTTVSSVERRKD